MTTTSSAVPTRTIDKLIQSLAILGPLDRRNERAEKDNEFLGNLQTLGPEAVYREFSASLAGLCVLHASVNRGDVSQAQDSKADVIAISLIPKDGDPNHLDLLSSGNKPIHTSNNVHQQFIKDSVAILGAISLAADSLPNSDSPDGPDLVLSTIRAEHATLVEEENRFILFAYARHMPKLKQRLLKRLPRLKNILASSIKNLKNKGQKTNIPALRSLQRHIETMYTIIQAQEIEREELHKKGRTISSIVVHNKSLFRGVPKLGTHEIEYVLSKVVKTARQVNNLVVLAACSFLRGHLNSENSGGKTFTLTFKNGFPFSRDGFQPGMISGRELMTKFNTHSSQSPRGSSNSSTSLRTQAELWKRLDTVNRSEIGNRSSSYVHCECILALEILRREIPGEYYIGCNKLSCTSCFYFLEATRRYGTQKKIKIVMDGTHGVSYLPWSMPSGTPRPLCDKFLEVLLEAVNEALCNQHSVQPQSDSDVAVDLAPEDQPNLE